MIVAVDTCILIDILIKDKIHFAESFDKLNKAFIEGKIIVCDVVVAEISNQFNSIEDLKRFLSDTRIELVPSSVDAMFYAGKKYIEYLSRREITCPSCESVAEIYCDCCNEPIKIRQHIVADFIIGSHALFHSDYLLTRDRGYYRKYFSDLKLY